MITKRFESPFGFSELAHLRLLRKFLQEPLDDDGKVFFSENESIRRGFIKIRGEKMVYLVEITRKIEEKTKVGFVMVGMDAEFMPQNLGEVFPDDVTDPIFLDSDTGWLWNNSQNWFIGPNSDGMPSFWEVKKDVPCLFEIADPNSYRIRLIQHSLVPITAKAGRCFVLLNTPGAFLIEVYESNSRQIILVHEDNNRNLFPTERYTIGKDDVYSVDRDDNIIDVQGEKTGEKTRIVMNNRFPHFNRL